MEALTCSHLGNGDSGEGAGQVFHREGSVLDHRAMGLGCVGTHRMMLGWYVWAQLVLEDGYHSPQVSYRTLHTTYSKKAPSKEQKDVSQQGWQ